VTDYELSNWDAFYGIDRNTSTRSNDNKQKRDNPRPQKISKHPALK
jgi:hypothetical protein